MRHRRFLRKSECRLLPQCPELARRSTRESLPQRPELARLSPRSARFHLGGNFVAGAGALQAITWSLPIPGSSLRLRRFPLDFPRPWGAAESYETLEDWRIRRVLNGCGIRIVCRASIDFLH